MGESVRFESRRVGPIEVPEADVVRFDTLPGVEITPPGNFFYKDSHRWQ